MAERRMFAKTIIDSDAFLDMPLSTQALYFHLSMRADDEGFINNPKKIQRMVGSSEDDLKLLTAKRFILAFDSGVIVIKHWKLHNYIRSDRFKPTMYLEEKSQLITKENKAYSVGMTVGIPEADHLDTQVRLGKVRLGKVSKDILSSSDEQNDTPNLKETNLDKLKTDFELIWTEYPKSRRKDKQKCFTRYKNALKDGDSHEDILAGLMRYKKEISNKQTANEFIRLSSTWFNNKNWNDDYDIGQGGNYSNFENIDSEWVR
ncbi:replisome organizer [Vagococcus fluvialis]|uniref:replisome organizer n=1 Tax=Vagococcus fluvialis TaxID=2738 RepID=UPI00288FEB27|nr:replisome organizer [Vagococcus fluvialis]MDT2782866.1 replisome organizer [Vagococcus fluvialis]